MHTTHRRGERRRVEDRRATTHRPAGVTGPARTAMRRAVAVAVAIGLAVAASGCVGRSGRNDDPVAPGSEGKARTLVAVRPLDADVVVAPPVGQAEL